MKNYVGLFACVGTVAVIFAIVCLSNQLHWAGFVFGGMAIAAGVAFWRAATR